jgi:hypothetical protein
MEGAIWWMIRAMLRLIAVFSFGGSLEALFRGGQWLVYWYQSDPTSDYRGECFVLGMFCLVIAIGCFTFGCWLWKMSRWVWSASDVLLTIASDSALDESAPSRDARDKRQSLW